MTHEAQLPNANENRPIGLRTITEAAATIGALAILEKGIYANESFHGEHSLYTPYSRATTQILEQEPQYFNLLITGFMASENAEIRIAGIGLLNEWHESKFENEPSLIAAEIPRWQKALHDTDRDCRYWGAYFVSCIGDLLRSYDEDAQQYGVGHQYGALLGESEHALLLEGPSR